MTIAVVLVEKPVFPIASDADLIGRSGNAGAARRFCDDQKPEVVVTGGAAPAVEPVRTWVADAPKETKVAKLRNVVIGELASLAWRIRAAAGRQMYPRLLERMDCTESPASVHESP